MRRWLNLALAVAIVIGPSFQRSPHPTRWQKGTVTAVLARMTPLEKVGQLFLVTFSGNTAPTGSDIDRLIRQYHVGGVVLLSSNNNYTSDSGAPSQLLALTQALQAAAVTAAQPEPDTTGGPTSPAGSQYIPLFVALNPDLDGAPVPGLTQLPSALAIGATWDAQRAAATGQILGRELAAVGVNMLLGPPLDVSDAPRPQSAGDLGVRTFGGDPFWVGVMGQAFVRGVHTGSLGNVAVVATHFPGYGASDRDPQNEVPTIRKSLEQLKQIELPPFFAVTGRAADESSVVDGLLTAHIRFQGFSGNIRETTRPVSLDAQTLGQLLALPELAEWRNTGGLTVSDALGSRAVKRYYDPSEQTFNPRRVALEAFNAGNDLLWLSRFGLGARPDQTNNIIDVIDFFVQKYNEDKVFADKVDAADARILALKLKLYGQFDPATATTPALSLDVLGEIPSDPLGVAEAATTLVAATTEALTPAAGEKIVFITDARAARPCAACDPQPLINRRAMELAVLQLYGPNASGQVTAGALQSFTFDDLAAFLTNTPAAAEAATPAPFATALTQADWLVFNMLDTNADVASSGVVSRFLAERPDAIRGKTIIAFAFGAPYYLDTTDLSKVSAFYAVYSHTSAFVEVAARLLFQGITPRGASPVSIPSVNYDISKITAPDPQQIIEIYTNLGANDGTATPAPAALKKGDTLPLRTGVIRDRNGHPVPDGTPVRFQVLYGGDELPAIREATTLGGVASTEITLNRTGQLQITAVSEPALVSLTLQLDVQENAAFFITVIAPTPPATDTPSVLPSVAPANLTPEANSTPRNGAGGRVEARDLFMMLLGLVAVWLGSQRLASRSDTPAQGVRVALAGAIGTLGAYNYFALGLPGAEGLAHLFGVWAATIAVIVGAGLGLGAGWYWFVLRGSVPRA